MYSSMAKSGFIEHVIDYCYVCGHHTLWIVIDKPSRSSKPSDVFKHIWETSNVLCLFVSLYTLKAQQGWVEEQNNTNY